MTRLLTLLLLAASLSGCSMRDVRQTAENIRVRAEGIGAAAEAERSDRLLAQNGGTLYRDAPQDEEESLQLPGQAEAGASAEAAAPAEKVAPPPPVYVIVPAR
jgi:hypothetical protein